MTGLYEGLVNALRSSQPRTASELADDLGTTRSQVNSLLYGRTDTFRHDGSPRPRWMLQQPAAATAGTGAGSVAKAGPPRHTASKRLEVLRRDLYDWQQRALDAWAAADHQGVVEAVTGAGKTRVGLTAIGDALATGHRVLVVVPTTVLLGQWRREIRQHLGIKAGVLGAGGKASLASHEVVVSTVQSASRIEELLPRSARGLLVCDEVHRYGADSFARVLQESFERRLGMTATFERNDDGLDAHLLPYFRRVVYSLQYREALDEGVIARFRVALVRVDLDDREQESYEEAHEEARSARYKLTTHYGVPRDPFGEFMAEVARLAEGPRSDQATKLARRFLSNFSESRRILGETRRKLDVLQHVGDAVSASQGTLVFASTVAGARRAALKLADAGIRSAALDSSMTLNERRAVLDRFEKREVLAMAAPLVLDEGVDVPEANLAIILAASKTRRQMIQRLGRVLRVKSDGGLAHLVLVVARNTSEDPASGAHMGFIEEMLDVADELRVFDTPHLPQLVRFLTGGGGGTEPNFELAPAWTAPDPVRRPADAPQRPATHDASERLKDMRRRLQDLERAIATTRGQNDAAPRAPTSRPVDVPLSLHIRIRSRLAKGPLTAAGLTKEFGVSRAQVIKVLEGSSEFTTRGRWWHLASEVTPDGEPVGPPVANEPIEEPPHPLTVAWEAAVGPMSPEQRASFESVVWPAMAKIKTLDAAERFVHRNRARIRAKLK